MTREERVAANQSLFREVNERIKDVSEQVGTIDGGPDFVCECADETCAERLHVSLADYTALRAHPRRFVVAPGHEVPEERVVVDRRSYRIVQKLGEAGEIAEQLGPES